MVRSQSLNSQRASWRGALWVLCAMFALGACDDGPSNDDDLLVQDGTVDVGTLDGTLDVGVPVDEGFDATPDANVDEGVIDEGLVDAEIQPDLGVECVVDAAPPPDGPSRLGDGVVRATLNVAGPPVGRDTLALNLDGDPDAEVEFVLARGGQVEVHGADGRLWWRSGFNDARSIIGVVDLDGDGRLEIVLQSARDASVIDGLTGAELWRLDPLAFGPDEAPITGVQLVELADVTGDGLPDLYLTEGGCSGEGAGRGVFLTFADGARNAQVLSYIGEPRRSGRCTRWHTLDDIDGDGRAELLLTDYVGLHVFDPLTGARRWCGEHPELTASGFAPHLSADALPELPGREQFVIRDGRVWLLGLVDEPTPRCPDPGHNMQALWYVEVGLATDQDRVVGVFDVDGDTRLDLLHTVWREDERWHTIALSGLDGAELFDLPDARLRAVSDLDGDDRPELLVALGSPRSTVDPDQLQLFALTAEAPYLSAALWPEPLADSTVIYDDHRRPASETYLMRQPLLLRGEGGARLAVERPPAAEDGPWRLALIGLDGVIAQAEIGQRLASAQSVCDNRTDCDLAAEDLLTTSLSNGGLAVYDRDLQLLNDQGANIPMASAPGSRVDLVQAFNGVQQIAIARTGAGYLGPIDFEAADDGLVWSVPVGTGKNSGVQAGHVADGPDVLLTANGLAGLTTIIALSAADGAVLWSHTADPDTFRRMGQILMTDAAGFATLVVRFDQTLTPGTYPDDLNCPPDLTDVPDPLATCEGNPRLRIITALDPMTGVCQWRTVLSPTECKDSYTQTVSVTDHDGDGVQELYVLEGGGIRQLDPATGAVLATELIDGENELGSTHSGGTMHATGGEPPLLKIGGHGPVQVLNADLTLGWRAEQIEGVRDPSWVARPAISTDDEIWASPVRGYPIYRYDLAFDGEIQPPIAQIILADGEQFDAIPEGARLLDPQYIERIPDLLGDGVDGVFVRGDDGYLYALDLAGQLAWSRLYPSLLTSPLIMDADADGRDEMLLPMQDGHVLLSDDPGPPAPPAAWDLLCPSPLTCDPDQDVDRTPSTTSLCVEWFPVSNIDGFELRVLGPNDAVVLDWQDYGLDRAALIDHLHLTPGSVYRVEVRGWHVEGTSLQYSDPAQTDGVLVVNEQPPTVQVSVDQAAIQAGVDTTIISVHATDDDLLTGWRLDILHAQSRDVVSLVASSPLAHTEYDATRNFNGVDRTKDPLPPGEYLVRATFYDRARNLTSAEVAITLCDGPCPP